MSMLQLPHASKMGKTFTRLAQQVTPPTGDTPEFVPAFFYDTQQYPQAGTASLTFFSNVGSTRQASNMDAAGVFPQPQYFEVHKLFVDILSAPTYDTTASNVGAINDLSQIVHAGQAIAQISIAQKAYPEIPLTACGRSGGPQGVVTGTLAAGGKLQAGWSEFTGGFPFNGALIIPPLTKFGVNITLSAAQAISANANIRVGMLGVLYRAVR